MPRTALTNQNVKRTGLTPTYGAANAAGHSFANSGRELLHVKTVGTPTTVTIQTPGTVDGLAVAELVISLLANEERLIGPFPPSVYNQAGDEVYVDFSAVTAVTVAALKI
jgi:hypothetical protein